ncbi:Fructosamine kinase domain-containing protein [Trichoderma pleuroticola]
MPSQLHELIASGSFGKPALFSHVEGSFPLDEALEQALPTSFTLLSATPFAKSDFSITGRLSGTMLPDNSPKSYFVKCASGDEGKMMLQGEHASLRAIEAASPGLVPGVVGFGEFKNRPLGHSIYFLIEDFLDLRNPSTPNPDEFAARIVALHLGGKSPEGKFGFPIPTCDGPLPHPVAWQETWSEFYAALLRSRVRMDAEACGSWPELERAAEQIVSKVVPRLLGSLTWRGKPIQPSLIHGDLWDANVGTLQTGETIIYDAGSYYAHNEMELGIWRVIYAETLGTSAYKEAYLRLCPPAEPADEWDDRNRLYSLKCNLNWSATDPGIITRSIAYNDMCYLCEKYAPLDGIAKYDTSKDPTVNPIAP